MPRYPGDRMWQCYMPADCEITIRQPQVIMVNDSTCVDVGNKPAFSTDKVEWRIDPKSHGVTDFHIIFLTKSPAQSKRRYFDKTHFQTGPLNDPVNNVSEDFEYVISVDLGDDNVTCDPHVIIIKGSI
jgi:hypothetical protein